VNRFAFILLILCFFAQACMTISNEQYNKQLVYEAKEISKNPTRFQIEESRCEADTLGRITIQLVLVNVTRDSLFLSSSDFELSTEDGLRSAPLSPIDLRIPSKSRQAITLVFEPVNTRRLFQLTGLKGDLGRSYALTFSPEGQIKFELPEAAYAVYKNSRREVQVFVLDYADAFESNQRSYLKNAGFTENGIAMHEEEVLVNGLNTALGAYTNNDTLVVKMRLVNHSLFPMSIKFSTLAVRHADQNYFPMPVTPDSIAVPRSQRAFIALRYFVPEKIQERLVLSIQSACFLTPKPVPVFYCDTLAMKHLVW
jgi:hypothetical protein